MPVKATFQNEGESLQHYGVLGMRWGVRHDKQYKSQKKRINADYKAKKNALWDLNKNPKKYQGDKGGERFDRDNRKLNSERKAAINKAKVDTANRLYSRNSQKANRRIQTRSTAKTLGLSALMGSYGTMNFDRARSEGKGVGKSAVRGVLSGYLNRASQVVPAPGGAASFYNYLQDRSDREKGLKSSKKNRRYIE